MAPEFAGKIATHDPKIIGGGQSVAIYLLDNMGEDFVKDFYLGQEVSIVGDYRLVTDTVARGTHFIGLSALSRDISKYRDQGLDNLAMLQMQDGPGFLIGGYGCIAIPKNSPNPNAAKLFANWYLSKRGQEMATTVYNIPSERVDVTDGPWPKFIEPAMGDEYLDMYTEAWHLTRRGELTARVNALLE